MVIRVKKKKTLNVKKTMKKEYIEPAIFISQLHTTAAMMVISNGVAGVYDDPEDGISDEGKVLSRRRRRHQDDWDDDEEDY